MSDSIACRLMLGCSDNTVSQSRILQDDVRPRDDWRLRDRCLRLSLEATCSYISTNERQKYQAKIKMVYTEIKHIFVFQIIVSYEKN